MCNISNGVFRYSEEFLKEHITSLSEHISLRFLYYKFVIGNFGLYCSCFQSLPSKRGSYLGLDFKQYYNDITPCPELDFKQYYFLSEVRFWTILFSVWS